MSRNRNIYIYLKIKEWRKINYGGVYISDKGDFRMRKYLKLIISVYTSRKPEEKTQFIFEANRRK